MKAVASKWWLRGFTGCLTIAIGILLPIAPLAHAFSFPGEYPPVVAWQVPPSVSGVTTYYATVTAAQPGDWISDIWVTMTGPDGYSLSPQPSWSFPDGSTTTAPISWTWTPPLVAGDYEIRININYYDSAWGINIGNQQSSKSHYTPPLPDKYPYLKVYGADTHSGGWFGSSCTGSQFQDYSYRTASHPQSQLTGGIITYSNIGGRPIGGSSDEYAAIATGNIDNSPGSSTAPAKGFYSGGAFSGSTTADVLAFANFFSPHPSPTNAIGGQFEGNFYNAGNGQQPDQCITDYYGQEVNDAATNRSQSANTFDFAPSGSCVANGVYYLDARSLPNQTYNVTKGVAKSVCAGSNITLVVNGNAYIDQPITYQAHNEDHVPKFAIITQGNIYIAPNVNEIDGWYIAQPGPSGTPDSNDGEIWTCYDNTNPNAIDYYFIKTSCGNQLVVNGAFTAKHVNFFRTNGDVQSATPTATADGTNTADPVAGEVINYTPDMVAGGPFFNKAAAPSTGGTGGTTPHITNIVNLPPIFSKQ